MKHLIIKKLGPIQDVEIELKRINLLIGEQSSGKSTINKTACYCSWVEKEISIAQSPADFEKKGIFELRFSEFHKLNGFIVPETYIEYETDVMRFSFSKKEDAFHFEWKDRWAYIRSKTIYIPAERNIVAAIPNWFDVNLEKNNIRSFMSDWEEARNYYSNEPTQILDLGVKYAFDKNNRKDTVMISENKTLDFTNVSSGLQSLVPLWLLLKYVTEGIYKERQKDSVAREYQNKKLIDRIYSWVIKAGGTSYLLALKDFGIPRKIYNIKHYFANKEQAKEFERIAYHFINLHYSNIFLEEPEENLYPFTQRELIYQMVALLNGPRAHNLFITTHSPYILTSVNNLLFASEVGKSKKKESQKIISQKYWVNFDDVGAWFVKNGSVTSILDPKLKQIKAEKIDEVSRKLNREYDKLSDLEYEVD
jgi:energy-coupling factor transporter ATP-binding protein EcfA2